LLEIFQHIYEHEVHVSGLIDKIVDIASEEKDKATQDFLWGFVREQVEEEATAKNIVEKLKLYGEHHAVLMDHQLGKR
jgi:ferritin